MRRHLSYANITSTLCLVLLLSGTAYAAATITGKDIKNSSVTGKDIKNSSLTGKDVKDASLAGAELKDGSVTGGDLLNGSASGADLLDGSVTGQDLLNGSVTDVDLLDGAVTSADVLDSSLTGDDVFADSLTGADVSGLISGDLAADAFPGAAMGKTSGTIPNAATNTLDMDTEIFDTDGMYTAPGDVITITRTGTYLCVADLHWGGAQASERQVRVVVDGTVVKQVSFTGGVAFHTQAVTVILRLTAGQQVGMGTYHNAGVAIPMTDVAGTPDATLTVQMISP